MTNEEYAVLLAVLQRAPLSLAEKIVLDGVLREIAPPPQPESAPQPAE